ncbi:MAG: hypothetical protein AB8E82_21120 [Aureispira sp.]
MADLYNLNFMHPQYGTTLNVDIDTNFSVQEILEQLVLSGFVGKANAEYDLELMGRALEKQTIFAAIPNLHDGAVLRVVERIVTKSTSTPQHSRIVVTHPILLHCKHPDDSLNFSASYELKTTLKEIISRAIQHGFLVGELADFELCKGVQLLSLEDNLHQQQLQEGDYLQFRRIKKEAPATEDNTIESTPSITLENLQEQVQQLEKSLSKNFQKISQQLPHETTLPDVGELPYESLEKVVRRIQKKGKEPSLSSLSLAGAPVWWYVLLVLVFLGGIAAVVVWALGNV